MRTKTEPSIKLTNSYFLKYQKICAKKRHKIVCIFFHKECGARKSIIYCFIFSEIIYFERYYKNFITEKIKRPRKKKTNVTIKKIHTILLRPLHWDEKILDHKLHALYILNLLLFKSIDNILLKHPKTGAWTSRSVSLKIVVKINPD